MGANAHDNRHLSSSRHIQPQCPSDLTQNGKARAGRARGDGRLVTWSRVSCGNCPVGQIWGMEIVQGFTLPSTARPRHPTQARQVDDCQLNLSRLGFVSTSPAHVTAPLSPLSARTVPIPILVPYSSHLTMPHPAPSIPIHRSAADAHPCQRPGAPVPGSRASSPVYEHCSPSNTPSPHASLRDRRVSWTPSAPQDQQTHPTVTQQGSRIRRLQVNALCDQ